MSIGVHASCNTANFPRAAFTMTSNKENEEKRPEKSGRQTSWGQGVTKWRKPRKTFHTYLEYCQHVVSAHKHCIAS